MFFFSVDVSVRKIMNPCCSAADLTCVEGCRKYFSQDEFSFCKTVIVWRFVYGADIKINICILQMKAC